MNLKPELLSGGSSGPGFRIGDSLIHNPDLPLEDALNQVKDLKKADQGLIVCFGLGLGYHLQALLTLWPEAVIIAFESDRELRRIYEENRPVRDTVDDRVKIASSWNELNDLLSEELVHGEHNTPAVFITPGYQKLFPEKTQTFKSLVFETTVRRRVADHTWREKAALFLDNLAGNIGNILKLPAITGLKTGHPPVPGFIVGSGPGLEKNGSLLMQARTKGLILAASSAVRPMSAFGVKPDLAVIVEGEDTSGYLPPDLANEETILAIGSAAHPNHFNIQGFARSFFHLTHGAAFICGQEEFVPQAGTAGAAAFTLAYLMGLHPLVLVGQDQAFGPNRIHAMGTPGEVALTKEMAPYVVNGANGERVRTHAAFAASLHWFAESARYLRRTSPGLVLLNASESGAAIPGVPNAALSDILKNLPDPQAGRPNLIGHIPELEKPNPERVRKNLEEAWSLLGQAQKLLRYDPRSAPGLADDLRSGHPFLKEALAGLGQDAQVMSIRNKIEEVEAAVLKMLEALD